jgi:hypothetical protein
MAELNETCKSRVVEGLYTVTASPASYTLEHFYFGHPVSGGQPQGQMRLLAHSSGVTSEIARAAVDHIRIPPLIRSGNNGSWALVRGNKQLPFVIVQAQIGEAGQTIHHYILIPNEALRAMGGSVRDLHSALVQDRLPDFENDRQTMPPLHISPTPPKSTSQQVDDILELMTTTRNNLDVIESLLAAIVQNVPLVVQGAPNELTERVNFIEGILSLLPPSVRFAVTFATHSLPSTETDAQIRFYSDDAPPKDTVVYNWPASRLTGTSVSSDYSRFVISQLRLDTEQVIERTRALTPTAGWRMRQGDNLADALAYGSYRQRIDEALLNNQPVNKDDVAKVLAQDPTLNDSLRLMYARHLLRLSLAMNDMQQADPVWELLPGSPELERGTLRLLAEAVTDQQSAIVFSTLMDWLSRESSLNYPSQWSDLLQRAAITRADEIVNRRQIDEADRFVRSLQTIQHPEIESLTPKLIERLLPLATKDAVLAENVFLLAARKVDTPILQRLLDIRPFVEQLQQPLRQALAYLTGQVQTSPKPGLLNTAASGFGGDWQPVVLLRLAELARMAGRSDLLDAAVLKGVADAALTSVSEAQRQRLLYLTIRPEQQELAVLGEEGRFQMLRLQLAAENYHELAAQMIQQSAMFYPGDRQIDYLLKVEHLFAETPLPDDRIRAALQGIQDNGIRSGPLVMAALGTLKDREPTSALNGVAKLAEDLIAGDPLLLGVIPPDSLLILLNYHARRGDLNSASRIAEIIPAAAARQGRNTVELSSRVYEVMQRDPKTRALAVDLLRAHIRQSEEADARQAVTYLGTQHGLAIRNILETTLLVRQIMNGHDLETYAGQVRVVARFLEDTASHYVESRSVPQTADLEKALNLMQGTFSTEERRFFTRNMLGMARALIGLYQQHRGQHGKRATGLLKAELDPASTLDVLRVIAGYCAQGRRYNLRLQPPEKPLPLSNRNRKQLNDEVSTAFSYFSATGRALSGAIPGGITAQGIRDEIESMIPLVSDLNRREVIRVLATDLQKVVDLIEIIAENGDAKALEDSSLARKLDSGRQRPRSTLEYYRYLHGYFTNHP